MPSRFEADLLMARLDEAGIQAMAKYGDADGMAPSIGLLDGYRVCVFDDRPRGRAGVHGRSHKLTENDGEHARRAGRPKGPGFESRQPDH